MHFKFRHLQKIVGGFFLLALFFLFALVVIVARGQRWFQHYAHYTTSFTAGGGLNAGAAVTIQGIEVGTVGSVVLDSDNHIRVDVAIFHQYADRIRAGTEAVLNAPFIGGSSIVLSLGPRTNPLLRPGSVIPAHEEGKGGLDELLASITHLSKQLEDPHGDLMQTLKNVNGLTKSLDATLADAPPAPRGKLASAIGHLDQVLAGLDNATPDIQDAIVEARRSLEEANKVIVALEKSIFLRGNIEQYLREDTDLRAEGR